MIDRDYCSCCGKPVYRGTYYDTAEGKLCFPCKLFKVEAQRDALQNKILTFAREWVGIIGFTGLSDLGVRVEGDVWSIEVAKGSITSKV